MNYLVWVSGIVIFFQLSLTALGASYSEERKDQRIESHAISVLARQGDVAELTARLPRCPMIRDCLENALEAAIDGECEPCVELLLRAGARPDQYAEKTFLKIWKTQTSPLIQAVSRGRLSIVKLLLSWQAQEMQPRFQIEDLIFALTLAQKQKDEAMMQVLLEKLDTHETYRRLKIQDLRFILETKRLLIPDLVQIIEEYY